MGGLGGGFRDEGQWLDCPFVILPEYSRIPESPSVINAPGQVPRNVQRGRTARGPFQGKARSLGWMGFTSLL